MAVSAPVFISYSRKDYYFAESLAFHLEKLGIPVWLDAKDLVPGASWQQQLENALDNAFCVVVVISIDSIKRPAVRMEWERAKKNGKRIILVLFRKARVPDELAQCEVLDFRARFMGPLRTLAEQVRGTRKQRNSGRTWLPLPPWVALISLTLLIPLTCYFLLANWSMGGEETNASKGFLLVLLPFFAFALFWFFCFSFLRRRMGMTHLAVCFAFTGAWSIYPLVRYWLAGPAGIADTWLSALNRNPAPMELSSTLVLAGLGIVLLATPEDLLRWTPTGKAWAWYRKRCLTKVLSGERPSMLRQVKQYSLLHDAVDGPAAKRLRAELSGLGASESTNPSSETTTILLLTSRTQTQWLTGQTQKLDSNALLLVGSRIGLPTQFEWLWRREWIDFRHWDLRRLERKGGLLQVPEAVTGTRFPAVVRLIHHLLCALAALAFCLLALIDPGFNSRPSEQQTPLENLQTLIVAAVCVWCGVLAQRLLNRTVSQRGFGKAWKLAVAGTCALALWALAQSASRQTSSWREIPIIGFLVACPFLFARKRDQLAFWFPTPGMSKVREMARLSAGRNWQTLIWISIYTFWWAYFTGMYGN